METLLGNRMTGTVRPKGVINALDLQQPGAKEAFVVAAKSLCDRGAGVIALACTGFSTLGIAPDLSRQIGVPVVDPVVAGGYFIRFMMSGRH